MGRFFSILLWTAVFLLAILAVDQLLVRVPASHPAHVAVADFYRDLRSRVFDLASGTKPPLAPAAPPAKPSQPAKPKEPPPTSIEAVIGKHQDKPAVPAKASPASPARPAAKPAAATPLPGEPKPRYSYVDAQGQPHFAETLAEVPEEYRGKVKALGE